MRMSRVCVGVAVLFLVGCGTVPKVVQAPPIPDDIAWSRPQPAVETSATAPNAADRPAASHEQVFAYEEGREFKVKVGLDVPLNIWLQPGEVYDLVNSGYRRPVAPGESEKESTWEIKTATSGEGADQRWHVTVTVTKPGLTNGVDILTNRHRYSLLLQSVEKAKYRTVRWTYPADEPHQRVQKPSLLPDPTAPQAYHVGYQVTTEGPLPAWAPRQVVDDGRKTYILLPPHVRVMDMPLVRLIGATGPELTNPLHVDSVIVLDGIVRGVELRVGAGNTAEVVRVTRGPAVRIECPGAPECPVWPPSAHDAQRERCHPRDTAH
jgi:type IV secretory pathway VirB9-like protein